MLGQMCHKFVDSTDKQRAGDSFRAVLLLSGDVAMFTNSRPIIEIITNVCLTDDHSIAEGLKLISIHIW